MPSASSATPSASSPLRPSATASTWPGMRVATTGVPQAAASVSVRPKPSRCDALHTTQARRYQSTSSSSVDPAREADPAVAAEARGARPRSAPRCGPSPTITASRSGTCGRARTTALQQVADALLRHQAGDGDDERRSARVAARA